MASPFVTKPGAHGTLYRFRVLYKQRGDDACPEMTWDTWAYDVEHAQDRFYWDDDSGWEILAIARVRTSPRETSARLAAEKGKWS